MVEVPLKQHSEDAVNRGDYSSPWFRSRGVRPDHGESIHGEFDPGSGRTLAACLTHASRTMNHFGGD